MEPEFTIEEVRKIVREILIERKKRKSSEKKGPSKKAAQKILRGTKTFKQKMQKVSSWAEDPAAAAAWMMHKATGKWPSEK
jgi:hypothetical protein